MGKKREEKERKEVKSGPAAGQPEKEQDPGREEKGDHDGKPRDPRKPKPKPKPKPKRRRTSLDTIIKAALEPYYPDLIQWFCGERPRKVSPFDPNLPVVRHRDADKILEISFKDRPRFLAHIEFQMRSDRSMPERMAEYLILIHRVRKRLKRKKTKYFCAVIYLSRKAFHGDPGGLVLEGESRTRLECTYDVIKLWEMDPMAALEMKTPGLWPFAPFMAGKMEELAVKSSEKIRAAPDSLLSPEQKGELFFLMTTLIARAVEDPKMRQKLLEDLSRDTDNPFVNLLRDQCRKECKAEGALNKARQDVLDVLKVRFGAVGKDVSQRILAKDDCEKLRKLLTLAAVAPDMKAFVAGIS